MCALIANDAQQVDATSAQVHAFQHTLVVRSHVD